MSVVLCDLSFNWPNGRPILSGLNAAFGPGRTGLIGVNGSGKSTLLRLIAGRLRPVSGSVAVDGDTGYLPQDLTLDTGVSVASLLGIARARDAIGAIEGGDVSEAAFEAVGDDWDIEDRALGWPSRLGLSHVGHRGGARRRHDPASPARHRGAGRADGALGDRIGRGVASGQAGE